MNEEKIEAEWGGNVRFIDPQFVSMKNSEGNEMMCKCGKRATFIAMGKESFIATCHDCSPCGGDTL